MLSTHWAINTDAQNTTTKPPFLIMYHRTDCALCVNQKANVWPKLAKESYDRGIIPILWEVSAQKKLPTVRITAVPIYHYVLPDKGGRSTYGEDTKLEVYKADQTGSLLEKIKNA